MRKVDASVRVVGTFFMGTYAPEAVDVTSCNYLFCSRGEVKKIFH